MKKKIILLGILAAVSFGVSTAVRMLKAPAPIPSAPAADANAAAAPLPAIAGGLAGGGEKFTPKEKQLDDLIRQLRLKLDECKRREQAVGERETRLAMTQDLLDKRVKELENLRVQLLAPLTSLKDEQAELERTRVRISVEEKANLKKTATIYEKMDPAAGSKILAGMCDHEQIDEAVKLLHYMSERAAAKIFAEMTDKTLAARLTERLKDIKEEG